MSKKTQFALLLSCFILNSCYRSLFIARGYPPNTQPLKNDKFLDVSYIECLHVLEFLYTLQKDPHSQVLYKRLLPKNNFLTFGPYRLDYTDPLFRMAPMPVSKEFAIEYCKWRGEVVTHMRYFGQTGANVLYSDIIKQNKEAIFIIKYSIPTVEELQISYKHKTAFKNYDSRYLTYDVLTKESTDTTKLYFLRCIATVE